MNITQIGGLQIPYLWYTYIVQKNKGGIYAIQT